MEKTMLSVFCTNKDQQVEHCRGSVFLFKNGFKYYRPPEAIGRI
jgi:hypothetical protein